MEDIRFKKNKKHIKREIIKGVLSIVLSLCMLIFVIKSNEIISIVIFIALIILGIYLIYNSLKNKDTVIVNEKGVFSRTNGMNLIKWEYIENFEIKKALNAKVLVININDTDKLLNEMNKVSKQLMTSNIKKLGSPVIIPESEFDESLNIVKERIENYKNSL